TSEAYASARQLQQQLLISISTALLAMVSVGYLFGRSFINPIVTLQRATHAVAAGDLGTRVSGSPPRSGRRRSGRGRTGRARAPGDGTPASRCRRRRTRPPRGGGGSRRSAAAWG